MLKIEALRARGRRPAGHLAWPRDYRIFAKNLAGARFGGGRNCAVPSNYDHTFFESRYIAGHYKTSPGAKRKRIFTKSRWNGRLSIAILFSHAAARNPNAPHRHLFILGGILGNASLHCIIVLVRTFL